MANKPFVILVGVDFSDLADRAFEQALELAAKEPGAELHAVFVAPTVSLGLPMPLIGVDFIPPLEALNAQLDERIRSLLDTALPRLRAAGLVPPARLVSHVRLETPLLGVLQLASDLDANLIVVGTHGRRGVARWVMGSVAEGVVRHANCPVLVVPPTGTDSSVPSIEPPCPRCVAERQASAGRELWCAQHRERHGRRHTYHQTDRVGGETNLPLVAH
jgi:nucleotide-binding universal stress UspA family protein